MMRQMKITGFDKLQKTLKDAGKAARELDGELAEISFNPGDPSSVEAAISDARLAIDHRLGAWSGNPLVDQMADAAKAQFEFYIFEQVEDYKLKNPDTPTKNGAGIEAALEHIRNVIIDMRRSDYQSFDRQAERLARALDDSSLAEIVEELTEGLDLEAWLQEGQGTQGGVVGSAKLKWPESEQDQIGITILLARHFSGDSREAYNFAFTFYYNGKKITPNLQHMVSQVFVPFERDFSNYVQRKLGVYVDGDNASEQAKYPRRVFLVHGHDTGVRESVARFLEQLNFEVIILHEQANKGRTIIEKFEQHADVGFAVILLTPDDFGRASSEAGDQLRARQNVILELGYFIGRLSRSRVMALRKGNVELPSDVLGVVYTSFDEAGAWKQALAKELEAAEYEVDWNSAMKG